MMINIGLQERKGSVSSPNCQSKNTNTALLWKHLFAYKMQHIVNTTLLSGVTKKKKRFW